MSNYPVTYFKKAISIIKSKALNSPQVDWKKVTAEAEEKIVAAKNTVDTYESINYVLSKLNDDHSFLISRTGKRLSPYKPFRTSKVLTRQNLDGLLVDNGKQVGFIVIPGHSAKSDSSISQTYARELQKTIAGLDRNGVVGWIIDLRGNKGGNMWPMLAGIGPIIGSGTLGYFRYPQVSIPWFYESGKTGVINRMGKCINFQIDHSISDCKPRPIAVLIDGSTASSGEAVAISLKGRESTCFFGSHTRGVSTNNETIKLADGATLLLTTSGECDRNNIIYEKGIHPDIEVDQQDISYGTAEDPAIEKALNWLTN